MIGINTNVKGNYYGNEYTGVVGHVRPHTINQTVKYYIFLDTPVYMNGEGDARDTIIINRFDDRPEYTNTIEEI